MFMSIFAIKNIYMRLLVTVLILFVSTTHNFAQENFICKDVDHLHNLEASSHDQLSRFEANIFTQNYDLTYNRIEIEVDPTEHYIKGAITSYFVPSEDGFQKIHFDLVSNMTINNILYHGNSVSSEFIGNDILSIDLGDVVASGVMDSITIEYEGAPMSDGFGSFATDVHGVQDTPVMWTLSEPYGAKAWWPCKQDLIDKIDSIDIIVKTPAVYKVASNGFLKGTKLEGNHITYHWSHRYKIPAYLVAFAVTNYEVFSDYVMLDNGDSIEVLNYVYPENLEKAKTDLHHIIPIMEMYNEYFGIYPFADEKYGHAQFGWGGGMEHQTMSFMGGFSYSLQAHELAHQWFGDKVTCGSWADIWLNEGFATYLTGLTDNFLKTENDWYNWKAGKVNSITNSPDGSVWVDDTTSVGRIFSSRLTYNKGSYLLHMLRWKLGDDNFFQACRNYLTDPNIAYSYARTSDLQEHIESISGLELTEFFDDWYYNQGYPSYNVVWAPQVSGIRIDLEQTTSHESVDFFEMPVPVLVSGEGQDSMLVLDHTYSGESFEIDLPFEVDEVVFDPELWILSNGNTVVKDVSSTNSTQALNENLVIHPNPISDIMSINLKNNNDYGIDRYQVLDMTGRLMIDKLANGQSEISISTIDWNQGTYIIRVFSGEIQGNKLVIKE